jgi:hypothetical protein
MRIKATDILIASKIMNSDIPSIFYCIPDINYSDIKILQGLMRIWVRLYTKKRFVGMKTVEGCPIIFIKKTKLYKECGVSTATFRKSINRLKEYGIVMEIAYGLFRTTGLALDSKFLSIFPQIKHLYI